MRTALGLWIVLGGCGGDETAGLPSGTVLVSDQLMPWGIAIDDASIYWTTLGQNAGPAQVLKMPKAGGTPTVLADDQQSPLNLAVDAENVYWTTLHGDVLAVPKTGGNVTQLAANQIYPLAIAVDATDVYFTNYRGGTIVKVPRTGGATTEVASGQALPSSLALSDHALHWTNGGDGTVMSADKIRLAQTTVATMQDHPSGMFVDASNLYWVNRGGPALGAVMKAPLGGGAPTPIATDQPTPDDVAVTSEIYWATWGDNGFDGTIVMAPGGRIIAGGQPHPVNVVADASGVYWTNAGWCYENKKLMRVLCNGGSVRAIFR